MMSANHTNYGSTPLIERQKQSKCKIDTCSLITKLILILVLCSIGYYIFTEISRNPSALKIFLNNNSDSKQYNKKQTEPKTIIIKYEYEDFLIFAPDSSISLSPLDSEIWQSFHEELILENGYDVNDKSVLYVFQVFDVQKHARTPKPSRSPMVSRTQRPSRSPMVARTQRPTRAPRAAKTFRPTKSPITPRPVNTPRPIRTVRPTKSPDTKLPTPAPTPLQSNMQCFTRYTDLGLGRSENMEPGASVAVNCLNEPGLENAELVGCITYAPGNDGFTSGEIIDLTDKRFGDKPQCKAWHRDSANGREYPITIGARCCISSIDRDKLYINIGNYSDSGANYYNRTDGEYCNNLLDCNNWPLYTNNHPTENTMPMMCTSFYGEWQSTGNEPGCIDNDGLSYGNPSDCGGWTGKSIGTKYIQQNGCIGARGEIGYLEQRSVCIGSIKGTIDCKWVSSNTANLNEILRKYESFVECPFGYVIADCNSYVDVAIDMCSDKASDLGISYGGHFPLDPSIQGCIAVGDSMSIRAQASCCRVSGA